MYSYTTLFETLYCQKISDSLKIEGLHCLEMQISAVVVRRGRESLLAMSFLHRGFDDNPPTQPHTQSDHSIALPCYVVGADNKTVFFSDKF